MEARHSGRAGQAAAQTTGPERTEPRERDDQEGEPAQALANLRAGFGDHITWERTFHLTTGHDGEAVYVDTHTGVLYNGAMPQLHHADGNPV